MTRTPPLEVLLQLRGGGAERDLRRQVLLLILSHISGGGGTGRYRGDEWPPRSQEGEMPARFELRPPPATHTHPCTLHQGPPIFLVRTRYCQAPAPAQARTDTAQPGGRDGGRAGLRMRVSRPDASLWTWGATSRTPGGRAPPAQDACAPLPLTRGDYLGTLNPVPKPRWGRLTRLFSNPGLAKEPRT